MKNTTIEITRSDFRNAGEYIDNNNCLLATAAKRNGFTGVAVIPGRLMTAEGSFNYSKRAEKLIKRSYPICKTNDDVVRGRSPRKNAKGFRVILHPV